MYTEKDQLDENFVFRFWKEKACQFPNLASLARHYLAIPATSVPSEQVFSLAGGIVTAKRARLKSKNTEMLVFCKRNYSMFSASV